jgi:hypothetical protein
VGSNDRARHTRGRHQEHPVGQKEYDGDLSISLFIGVVSPRAQRQGGGDNQSAARAPLPRLPSCLLNRESIYIFLRAAGDIGAGFHRQVER